jgi:cell division protein ZapA
METKIEVVIDGHIITLKSDENEEYMQKLASYIDRKMAQVKRSNASISVHERLMTVYLAINVADDYFKAQERYVKQGGKQAANMLELDRLKDENELLKEKISDLHNELKRSREELDEYIKNFDSDKIISIQSRTAL